METDRRVDQIELLIELLLQIDDAVLAEAGDRVTGLRVERRQAIPGVTYRIRSSRPSVQ